MIENMNRQFDEKKQSQEKKPKIIAKRENKLLGLFGFIKKIFNSESNNIIYGDGETDFNEAKMDKQLSNDVETINIEDKVKHDEIKKAKNSNEYSDIIEYAKGIKKDKENYKLLQNKYADELKANNKEQVTNIKNMLWELENKITLSESFLRNKLKEIRRSSLSIEEKTKLINYICGIARMKVKEKQKHLKEEIKLDEIIKSPVDELNERKEKIILSKNFTVVQKKNMIREIDDELIELAKKEETKDKSI